MLQVMNINNIFLDPAKVAPWVKVAPLYGTRDVKSRRHPKHPVGQAQHRDRQLDPLTVCWALERL